MVGYMLISAALVLLLAMILFPPKTSTTETVTVTTVAFEAVIDAPEDTEDELLRLVRDIHTHVCPQTSLTIQ